MKIQYLGHSCFRIISETGTAVVCDPYDSDYVGLSMPTVRCDLVTVSHHHADHDATDALAGSYATADAAVSFPADDIAVSAVSSYHDENKGAKRGKNIVFGFSVDGLKVVHMGDIGCFDTAVCDFARGCDVLMIPVGGIYTVDAGQAKRYVDEIAPAIVIPMHYAVEGLKFRLEPLDGFLSLFDVSSVERFGRDSLELYDLPEGKTRVVVLERYSD